MNKNNVWLIGLALALLAADTASAQPPTAMQANPTPGCTATPAQLAANKKVVAEFFRTRGADRVALADPSYKQHNPAFKKRAEDNKVSDYEEFKATFLKQAAGGGGAAPGQTGALGQQPPPGNPLEVVTAECDIVTAVHKGYRQDPTAETGKFYEVFTFDTFRVKDGKLVEHWDGAVINPPAPAAGR
jgi:predicted SnoaL-like aldol condensation-catalyzing enzyme